MRSRKEIVEGYDTFWESSAKLADDWANLPISMRHRAVKAIPSEITEILDLGCGNGQALKVMAHKQIQLYGIDISRRALSVAKKYADVIQADMSSLPIHDGKFRCILMLDVFEHVQEKRIVIEELHRTLAESGIVIMTTPQPRATGGLGDDRQPYDKPMDLQHIVEISSDLFKIEGYIGCAWLPFFWPLEYLIPLPVGFALFKFLPKMVRRSDFILLILRKKKGACASPRKSHRDGM